MPLIICKPYTNPVVLPNSFVKGVLVTGYNSSIFMWEGYFANVATSTSDTGIRYVTTGVAGNGSTNTMSSGDYLSIPCLSTESSAIATAMGSARVKRKHNSTVGEIITVDRTFTALGVTRTLRVTMVETYTDFGSRFYTTAELM